MKTLEEIAVDHPPPWRLFISGEQRVLYVHESCVVVTYGALGLADAAPAMALAIRALLLTDSLEPGAIVPMDGHMAALRASLPEAFRP